jgi:hypothetical protein
MGPGRVARTPALTRLLSARGAKGPRRPREVEDQGGVRPFLDQSDVKRSRAAGRAKCRRSPGIVRSGRHVYQEAGWRPL